MIEEFGLRLQEYWEAKVAQAAVVFRSMESFRLPQAAEHVCLEVSPPP